MSRELWLLRHSKAEINGNIDDFDRALKKRCKKAAQRMGLWMKQQQLQPDWVISSPAIRALSTARLVCPIIGIAEQDIHPDKRLYMANLEVLHSVLASCSQQSKRVLLIGHNPGLEELLHYLAESLPELEKLMPTTAFVRLSMPDAWHDLSPGCAELREITHVKSLL